MEPAERVVIERVTAADTHAIRREVLRSHAPELGVDTPADDNPAAVHLAASLGGEIIGVVSVAPSEDPLAGGPGSWRLSGMAVRAPWQSHGVGSALIDRLVEEVTARRGRLVWAQARDTALAFYERHGFRVLGEAFEHAHLPHHAVVRELQLGRRDSVVHLSAARRPPT